MVDDRVSPLLELLTLLELLNIKERRLFFCGNLLGILELSYKLESPKFVRIALACACGIGTENGAPAEVVSNSTSTII